MTYLACAAVRSNFIEMGAGDINPSHDQVGANVALVPEEGKRFTLLPRHFYSCIIVTGLYANVKISFNQYHPSPEEHLLDQPVGGDHPHLPPCVQPVELQLAGKEEQIHQMLKL